MRTAFLTPAQAADIEPSPRLPFPLLLAHLLSRDFHGEHDVAERGAPRKQHRPLEHVADMPRHRRLFQRAAIEAHFARARRQDAGKHFEERRLAATGRPHHGQE